MTGALGWGVLPARAQRLIPPSSNARGTLSFRGSATTGDLPTLLTGNDRRDRDLNRSMESDPNPSLRFELTGLRRRTLVAADVTLVGTMFFDVLFHRH